MSRRSLLHGVLFPLILSASPLLAVEIRVAPDGSGDAPTIAAAIAMAGADDVIVLEDGVFSGPGNRDLVLPTQAVRVRSASGDPLLCTIDLGGYLGFYQDATYELSLDGITITGGYDYYYAGAVRCVGGWLKARNCRFVNNRSGRYDGGAVDVFAASGRQNSIEGCEFIDNWSNWGAAAAEFAPDLIMTDCVFRDHVSDFEPILLLEGGTHEVSHCLFVDNDGASIVRLTECVLDMEWCVFSHNESNAGNAVLETEGVDGVLRDCTFMDNGGADVADISQGHVDPDDEFIIERTLFAGSRATYSIVAVAPGEIELFCCNISSAGAGWHSSIADQLGVNGNIDANPLYCDPAGSDFSVWDISPCLPANNSCGVQIGAFGEGCVSEGYVVFDDGHGALPDIQTAIDVVPTGGEVLLADGAFTGPGNVDLDFGGKPLTLRSQSGDPALCVIDAGGAARVFHFQSAEDASALVQEVGIRGGFGDVGGGVLVEGAAPRFVGCRFEANSAVIRGGGLAAVAGAAPLLEGCVFVGNVGVLGSAIAVDEAQADLVSCTVAGNLSPAAAIHGDAGDLTLTQTLIAHNGAGAGIALIQGATAELTACDIFGNEGGDWTAPIADQLPLRDNFSEPPCFCDLEAGLLTLCADSWCLPENNPAGNGLLVGALGVGCDACGCPGILSTPDADLGATSLAAHPNPFNPSTTITYRLDRAGQARLAVFDLRGHLVAVLRDGALPAGDGHVEWNGRDGRGRAMQAGVYVCRLEAVDAVQTVMVSLVK